MPDQTGESEKGHRLHTIVAGLIAMVIVGVSLFALERANNIYVLAVSATVLAAVTLWTFAILASISKAVEAGFSLPQRLPRRARLILIGGTVLAIVTVSGVVFEATRPDICPQALELRILASPDGAQATRELAQEYTRATARDNEGCPAVYPYVYAAGTSVASGALARMWTGAKQDRPLEHLGPRPDIWLPDSMLDVRQVEEIVVKGTLPSPLAGVTSIGSSPLVLAGTRVTDAPESTDTTLPKLVSAVLDRPGSTPALAAADPQSSTAGLLAADVYLRDAEGEMVGADVARRRAQIVADSAASAGSEAGLLCAYLREGRLPETALTSLRTWKRYLKGKPLGTPGCTTPRTPPSNLPEPVVLASAPALDLPFVQFTWTSTRHRAEVERFRAWLLGEDADPYLREAGLGEPHSACADLALNACLPRDPKKTLSLYERAKRPGRVLLAVDTSGSMADPAGPGRATRFTVAAQGVGEALGRIGARDEFGLWSFPAVKGRTSPELVSVGPGTPQHRTTVVDTLRTVKPAGATPLYSTVVAGMRELAEPGGGDRIRAMVVLTDGENTSGDRSLERTVAAVKRAAGADVRLYVIATGEASCDDGGGTADPGPLYQLARAGRGACLPAGAQELPETMTRLFETLWSGK
ncbi:vWA domain-containing protein [Actinoplanes missouriensis]|uniref:vWA domain-containing protein n=1 Tax=Actinoplanes missouriensis TaxID=1866 RepID=UPI0033C8B73E